MNVPEPTQSKKAAAPETTSAELLAIFRGYTP